MRHWLRHWRNRCVLLVIVVSAWVVGSGTHAYIHVRSLEGQCCGYEGDPGFLFVFFMIWPGLVYFVALFLILIVGVLLILGRERFP
jgi:hypothetical protein